MNDTTTHIFDNFKKAELFFSEIKEMPDEIYHIINDSTKSMTMSSVSSGTTANFALSWFHVEYSKFFSLDFLSEKAKGLSNKVVKAWIMFCIKHVKAYIEYYNEEFDEELYEFDKYSDLSYDNLISLFNPYKPFISQYDYFRFAYDNLDSPVSRHFLVLLLMLIDVDYPIKPRFDEAFQRCKRKDKCEYFAQCKKEKLCTKIRQCWNEDYNFDDEMNEFERILIYNFIRLAPIQDGIKNKAFTFILKMFEMINQTGRYRDKLSTSTSIFNSKNLPLTGNLFITWDKVDFYDGFYLIQHPKTSYRDTSKVYSIKDANSRKVFNEIGGYFLKKLPPIYAEFKNGVVQKILNRSDLSSIILTMEHKVSVGPKVKKEIMLKPDLQRKELSKSEARERCKELKSLYLDYLANAQLEDYKVICSIEKRVNASNDYGQTEYSFIFTIKRSGDSLYLAYENVKNSRCTYIFQVPKDKWLISIDKLYEFFASNETNKRQSLARRIVDLELPGNYDYKRIMHADNFQTWVDKIR